MEALGGETWFRLGDRDMALHVERTRRLKRGETLSAVTADLCRRMGVGPRVVPMSDDPVRTRLRPMRDGWISRSISSIAAASRWCTNCCSRVPARRGRIPDFLAALGDPSLQAMVICPSNPFISVEPILAIPGVRQAMIDVHGADHRGVADHRRPGGQGSDRENDDGTGAGSQRRDGRSTLSRSAGWLRHRSCRHVGGRFDRRAGDSGADVDATMEDREALARIVLDAAAVLRRRELRGLRHRAPR